MKKRDYQLTIANTGATIVCRSDQTVLQAAMGAGIDYPFACASGNCGMCVSQLTSGKVSMLPRADSALSPEQAASGKTLACRAQPHSDLAVSWLGRGGR
jgi:ferredoxin-NAD(P)+ reductase (naphthalene dioxygenase ferredoxin-specific)